MVNRVGTFPLQFHLDFELGFASFDPKVTRVRDESCPVGHGT